RAPNLQAELVHEFVDQISETGEMLISGLKDFKRFGKPTPDAKVSIANGIRKLFAKAVDLQDVIERLPSGYEGGQMQVDPSIVEIKKGEDVGVLPTQEELGVGEVRKRWESLMETHPWSANLCRACEMACTQVFRINYRLS